MRLPISISRGGDDEYGVSNKLTQSQRVVVKIPVDDDEFLRASEKKTQDLNQTVDYHQMHRSTKTNSDGLIRADDEDSCEQVDRSIFHDSQNPLDNTLDLGYLDASQHQSRRKKGIVDTNLAGMQTKKDGKSCDDKACCLIF